VSASTTGTAGGAGGTPVNAGGTPVNAGGAGGPRRVTIGDVTPSSLPPLRFGTRAPAADRALVMAIVNRTPDSFYDRGATFAESDALAAVDAAVAEGADIVDIGGVKAGPAAPWTPRRRSAAWCPSWPPCAPATRIC